VNYIQIYTADSVNIIETIIAFKSSIFLNSKYFAIKTLWQ